MDPARPPQCCFDEPTASGYSECADRRQRLNWPKNKRNSRFDSETASQGNLFSSDFLTESIQDISEWSALGDADLAKFGEAIRAVFDRFPVSQTPNESQTEDDLIWPILEALG